MNGRESSNSNRPWDSLELLPRRKEAVPLLEELGFLQLLETLAKVAARPVPHTVHNWLVQRAMQDGNLQTLELIQGFFDETMIQDRIKQLQHQAADATKPRSTRPDMGQNPFSPIPD